MFKAATRYINKLNSRSEDALRITSSKILESSHPLTQKSYKDLIAVSNIFTKKEDQQSIKKLGESTAIGMQKIAKTLLPG